MKTFLFLVIFISHHSLAEEVSSQVWFKTRPENQPRYYLKGSKISLCGLFGVVKAHTEEKNKEPLLIQACLIAKGSLDSPPQQLYEIIDLIGDKLYFRKVVDEDLSDQKPIVNSVYSASPRYLASLWGIRFPEGEIMIAGPQICDEMYSWREKSSINRDSEFLKSTKLPFETKSQAEPVRYHVFEYHMGCGT